MTMTRDTSTPTARELVKLLVWFAQARIKSTAQVERRFMKVTKQTATTFKEIHAEDVDSYRNVDQPRARDWLLKVIALERGNLSAAERLAFQQQIAAFVVEKITKHPRPVFGRTFRLEWETPLDGVEVTTAYAVALLLADPMLRRRVGHCANEDCNKFFFDDRERGGMRKDYCCTTHSDKDRKRRQRRQGG